MTNSEHSESSELLKPVIFIMGPTASGKTDLAMQLSVQLNAELVSVDSALIYQSMDIGTAKPTPTELKKYPHRLIDIRDPSESYSAADFRKDALQAIQDIQAAGKKPILVGGTMMYFKVLLEGISPLPAANHQIRHEIEQQAQKKGWDWLHQQLMEIDPAAGERIHPNDPQRLSRALEVYRISGKTMTQLTASVVDPMPYPAIQFAIYPVSKEELRERIAIRFKQMLSAGFKQEVEMLRARGDLHLDLPSMRCVGYRQMWEHLDGKMDWDEMQYRGIVATRQLAKRQMTWLKNWPNIKWLTTANPDNLSIVLQTISNY